MIERLKAGNYWVRATVEKDGDRLNVHFPYNKTLLEEIKSMKGRRWHHEEKHWSVLDCQRNRFQLQYLAADGKEIPDPYDHYFQPLLPQTFRRPLRSHQQHMVQVAMTYRRALLAAEQGLGKSLVAIEVMERSGFNDWLYVGPRSAIASFELELMNWDSGVTPSIVTYEKLERLQRLPDMRPPKGIIFDECQRIKTPTSKRSVAAAKTADMIRDKWGDDAFILLLSGTPAPKSPLDYWHPLEVACPGYLREGDLSKFENRLSLVKMVDGPTGRYPVRVTWWDSEEKCQVCGALEEDHSPEAAILEGREYHAFVPSVNEVEYLKERMNGLVYIYRKKDYLSELPDLQYRVIRCQPSEALLRAAKIVANTAESAIQGLTRLRELSDGFLYTEEETGREVCPKCNGDTQVEQPVPVVDSFKLETALEALYERAANGEIDVSDPQGIPIPEHLLLPDYYEMQMCECWHCGGAGDVPILSRIAKRVECPKDEILESLMEDHDEDGRLVVFAGFTASLDRIVEIASANQWSWIRVDGSGWRASPDLPGRSPTDLITIFQKGQKNHPKILLAGQPESAGTGLTLTASCEIVNFSNTFNGEARLQSEHRIHRPGMDINKGAMITDIIHLPSDELVLLNLREKKRLQELSLGVIQESLT
jgi:hypothetical protein